MTSRLERFCLAVLFSIFIWFTWRGLIMFYSGDDMMNMYFAWNTNPWTLAKSQLMFWIPLYRPLGALIYRTFYALFGFHPEPLYVFCWLLLAGNVAVGFRFFRSLTATVFEALIALSLTLVHGSFQDLYLSAGTIYDRLWFLFTALGIIVYARMRKNGEIRAAPAALICLICILAMDSKESGVTLPAMLACYECIFVLPEVWRESRVRDWLGSLALLYSVLAIVSAVFVFMRVNRTPELVVNAAYRPHASFGIWFTRVAEYFSTLAYRHVSFSPVAAGLTIATMGAAAILLRNRAMMFGWLLFAIAITPVALISQRPGYVLYVPDLGLGLYLAAAIAIPARMVKSGEVAAFAAITIAITWFHVRNWPGPFDPAASPEFRLTQQFRREYPTLAPGSKLLFLSDEFPKYAFDLLFNLRFLYHDQTLVVNRVGGPPDQQPDPKHPIDYDHVFLAESGHYVELQNRDVAESVRLHILRGYSVGRWMDVSRRDHPAYVVSGLMDGDNNDPSRWTAPRARFKYDLFPAPSTFSAKFWVPDFVAKGGARIMSIQVDGREVGTLALTKDGMNEIAFPVPASAISSSGYTFVDMNVSNPYKDRDGTEFGIVLLYAGFEYRH